MPIRKLSPLLVNQIAAGEVIERPASVVKELLDNSLDAGATRIDIAIEDGGRQLIRISDDGNGIPADELPLAVAPHATSKLHDASQLAAIETLGFRGEALASIASVSRLRITSRPRVDGKVIDSGAMIEASGEHVADVSPIGAAPGTVMEVRDLFFNTPARRKFLKAATAEFAQINEMVRRIAMVRPDVAFTLSHNGRKVLDLVGGMDKDARRRRVIEVLGKELDEALLEFELHEHAVEREDGEVLAPATVWGLAGLPSIARASSKFQHLCLNGRPIRDRRLLAAIKEAYRGLMPPDRQPVAAVFLYTDPAAVDVNVHPAKTEVRFREPGRMFGLVLAGIRQRLLQTDLTPQVFASTGSDKSWLRTDEDDASEPLPWAKEPVSSDRSTPSTGLPQASAATSTSTADATRTFVDYFKRMAPQQKGFVYEQVRQAYADENPNALLEADDAPLPAATQPIAKPARILQVHDSYLVTQDDSGIVIVDQHALHERVMFEELRHRVLDTGKPLESQRLLMPAVVDASLAQQATLEDLQPMLSQIGIEVEPIGRDAVGVQAFPSFLFERNVDPVTFIEELMDRAEADSFDLANPDTRTNAFEAVLSMMACKAAVKAGDGMTESELAALLARRDEIERSGSCPHGRPTTIRLSIHDLERQFKRT
jgi:DNA mismatch repair protein MutL